MKSTKEIDVCDFCHTELNLSNYVSAKMVHHQTLAATPIIWGEWCSVGCFLSTLNGVIRERNLPVYDFVVGATR
jgi:hypothetical protein